MVIVDKLLLSLGLDTSEFDENLTRATQTATQAGETAQRASAQSSAQASAAAAQGGEGAREASRATAALRQQMAEADKQFDDLGKKWAGAIKSAALGIAAPITAAFAIWRGITSYTSQVAEVAQLTGGYSQKLEEWRIKRAMLSRVTREDIELYRKSRETVVGFQIAMQDLSAKIARQLAPAFRMGLDLLERLTKWIQNNTDNLARFFVIIAGVITAVFLPALVRMGAALLMNPLTWIIVTLGALILVIDDLVTYIHGGTTALGGFWSIFGTGEEIGRAVASVLEWIKSAASALAPALIAVATTFAAFKIGVTIFTGLSVAIKAVAAAFALLTSPIGLIIAAIALIAGLIGTLINAWNKGGGTLAGMFGYLRQQMADLVSGLGPIGDIILAVFDAIAAAIQWIADRVSEAWPYVTAAFSKLGEIALAIGTRLYNFFQGVIDVLSAIGAVVVLVFSTLADWILSAVDQVMELKADFDAFAAAVSAAFNNALSMVANRLRAWRDAIANAFAPLIEAVTGTFNRVRDFVTGWLDRLAGMFRTAFSTIGDIIKNIFSGIWQAISDMFNPAKLVERAKDAVKSLGGKFMDIFGGDEEEQEGETEEAAQAAAAEAAPEPQSNGLMAWTQAQPEFSPAEAPTPTEQIYSSVNNSAPVYNTTASQSKSVQQTNNITINAGNADPQALRQAFSQEMALQNDKLQRQTMAVETGTRV